MPGSHEADHRHIAEHHDLLDVQSVAEGSRLVRQRLGEQIADRFVISRGISPKVCANIGREQLTDPLCLAGIEVGHPLGQGAPDFCRRISSQHRHVAG